MSLKLIKQAEKKKERKPKHKQKKQINQNNNWRNILTNKCETSK